MRVRDRRKLSTLNFPPSTALGDLARNDHPVGAGKVVGRSCGRTPRVAAVFVCEKEVALNHEVQLPEGPP